jgi:hypothetical protein
MTRKLIGEVLDVATGVARHVVWYISYQIDGTTHDEAR